MGEFYVTLTPPKGERFAAVITEVEVLVPGRDEIDVRVFGWHVWDHRPTTPDLAAFVDAEGFDLGETHRPGHSWRLRTRATGSAASS